jgi:hypothetical protein
LNSASVVRIFWIMMIFPEQAMSAATPGVDGKWSIRQRVAQIEGGKRQTDGCGVLAHLNFEAPS